MKYRRYIPLLIVAALAFQATEAVRVVYTQFNLSPDCPIVGNQNPTASVAASVSGNHCHQTVVLPSEEGQDDPASEPQQPAGKGGECDTCSTLAVMRSYVSVQFVELPNVEFTHRLSLPQPAVRYAVHAFDPFHGRAPPASLTA